MKQIFLIKNITLIFLLFCLNRAVQAENKLSLIAQEVADLKEHDADVKKRYELKSSFNKYLLTMVDKVKALEAYEKNGTFEKISSRFFHYIFSGLLVEPAFDDGLILLTQEQAPKLHVCVESLCASLKIPKPLIFLAQNKDFFNACALSLSHNLSCMIVGEPMLNKFSDAELKNLFAHELAHIKYHHVPKKLCLSMAGLAAPFLCLKVIDMMTLTDQKRQARDVLKMSNGFFDKTSTKIMFFLLFSWAYSGLQASVMRNFEKEADLTAMQITEDSQGFVSMIGSVEDYLDQELSKCREEYNYVISYLEKLDAQHQGFKNFITFLASFYFGIKDGTVRLIKEGGSLFLDHPSLNERKEYGAAFQK